MDLKIAVVAGAVGALAGCAGTAEGSLASPTDTAAQPDPASTGPTSVDENLVRLRSLTVFTVGELIVNLPAEASNCYGPCPGSAPAIAKAKDDAAARLDKLVDIAESAVKAPVADACAQATIDQNIAALKALQIVDVQGLILEHAKVSGQCYAVPCPADIEAAKAITCERAGKLASIVNAAKGL